MIEYISELDAASNLLDAALDRYLDACAAVQTCSARAVTDVDHARALADRITRELSCASSYELKAKRAKSIIGGTSNFSNAPIHAFPSEILARIFLLVVGDSCGITAKSSRSRSMPRYPDFLSHVCSRWRSIAINLPALWTHIDLAYYHLSDQKYVDRAKVFVSRTGHLPLDVHIRAPTSPDLGRDPDVIYDFLPSIITRTRSLDLVIASSLNGFDDELFENLFDILESATIFQFSITDHAKYPPAYICAYDADSDQGNPGAGYDCHYIDLPLGVFEDILLPVKVLRLDGLYPYWASQAYRGLVELRLYQPSARECGITTNQLHNILVSCPGLVILHFELEITDEWTQSDIVPVYLGELEELYCDIRDIQGSRQQETFLGLIAPGPKELHLTMHVDGRPDWSDPNTTIVKFMKRSNIQRLFLCGLDGPTALDDLLGLIPRARALALTGYSITSGIGPFVLNSEQNNPSLHLDSLHFETGYFDLESLCLIARACSPQAIVLWQTAVCRDKTSLKFDAALFDEDNDEAMDIVEGSQVQIALSEFCPFVKQVAFDMESPTRSWGFRDAHS